MAKFCSSPYNIRCIVLSLVKLENIHEYHAAFAHQGVTTGVTLTPQPLVQTLHNNTAIALYKVVFLSIHYSLSSVVLPLVQIGNIHKNHASFGHQGAPTRVT